MLESFVSLVSRVAQLGLNRLSLLWPSSSFFSQEKKGRWGAEKEKARRRESGALSDRGGCELNSCLAISSGV